MHFRHRLTADRGLVAIAIVWAFVQVSCSRFVGADFDGFSRQEPADGEAADGEAADGEATEINKVEGTFVAMPAAGAQGEIEIRGQLTWYGGIHGQNASGLTLEGQFR